MPNDPEHELDIDGAPIPVRVIDCDECVMAHSAACDDCVVSFVVNRSPGDALVVDAASERALRTLGAGGLVPRLRHARHAG